MERLRCLLLVLQDLAFFEDCSACLNMSTNLGIPSPHPIILIILFHLFMETKAKKMASLALAKPGAANNCCCTLRPMTWGAWHSWHGWHRKEMLDSGVVLRRSCRMQSHIAVRRHRTTLSSRPSDRHLKPFQYTGKIMEITCSHHHGTSGFSVDSLSLNS